MLERFTPGHRVPSRMRFHRMRRRAATVGLAAALEVDYRRQLLRSSQTHEVLTAYRAVGLDLDADLAALNGGPASPPTPRPPSSWSTPVSRRAI